MESVLYFALSVRGNIKLKNTLISQAINFVNGPSTLSTCCFPLNVDWTFFVSHPFPLQRLLKMWLPEYGLSHSWVRMLSCIDMHWVNGCLLKSRKKTCHGSYYIDLAGPESEALGNIYSLLKQNIKSCNAKAAKVTRTVKKEQKV